jgi:hypothetical protein
VERGGMNSVTSRCLVEKKVVDMIGEYSKLDGGVWIGEKFV